MPDQATSAKHIYRRCGYKLMFDHANPSVVKLALRCLIRPSHGPANSAAAAAPVLAAPQCGGALPSKPAALHLLHFLPQLDVAHSEMRGLQAPAHQHAYSSAGHELQKEAAPGKWRGGPQLKSVNRCNACHTCQNRHLEKTLPSCTARSWRGRC